MKRFQALLLILFHAALVRAQGNNDHPVVGQSCPDFILNDVKFYSKKQVSLKDFRGKWLVIDCWNRYCANCIEAMPRMDSIRRKLNDKLEIIYVGYTGYLHSNKSDDKEIRALYERVRREHQLQLPMAFDSLLMDRFKIAATPYVIIIDGKGIVRGLTTHVSEADLTKMMNGEVVELKKAYRWQKGIGRIE